MRIHINSSILMNDVIKGWAWTQRSDCFRLIQGFLWFAFPPPKKKGGGGGTLAFIPWLVATIK